MNNEEEQALQDEFLTDIYNEKDEFLDYEDEEEDDILVGGSDQGDEDE